MNNIEIKEEANKKLDAFIAQAFKQGINIFSYSGATGYKMCPYAYHRGHTPDEKGEIDRGVNNIYALVGGVLHDALETIYDGGENHLKEAFDQVLKKCKKENINFPNEGVRTTYLVDINHYIKHFKKHNLFSINEMPFLVEYKGNKIRGYVDQITKDPNSKDGFRILDYKTSTKYVGKVKKEHGRQLILYAYAIEKIFDVKVTSLVWDFLKYVKIDYSGKTRKRNKIYPRSQFILSWKDEILRDLEEEGVSKFAAIDLFTQALKDLEFPPIIAHKFKMSPALVECEYNDETKEEALEYLHKQIENIKKETEWKAPPKHEFESLFFCENLCNYRLDCQNLKAMRENLAEDQLVQSDFKRLFRKK